MVSNESRVYKGFFENLRFNMLRSGDSPQHPPHIHASPKEFLHVTRISALLSALMLCLTFIGANAFAEDTPTLKVGSKKVARRAQVVVKRRVGQININTASAIELSSLKGIGKKKAMLIIKDREANGPFATPQDLTRIKASGRRPSRRTDRISQDGGEQDAAARCSRRRSAKRCER